MTIEFRAISQLGAKGASCTNFTKCVTLESAREETLTQQTPLSPKPTAACINPPEIKPEVQVEIVKPGVSLSLTRSVASVHVVTNKGLDLATNDRSDGLDLGRVQGSEREVARAYLRCLGRLRVALPVHSGRRDYNGLDARALDVGLCGQSTSSLRQIQTRNSREPCFELFRFHPRIPQSMTPLLSSWRNPTISVINAF